MKIKIHRKNAEKIMKGETNNIIVKGYLTLPLYSQNQEVIDIEDAGSVAVRSFSIVNREDLENLILENMNLLTVEELKEYLENESVVTLAEVVKVMTEDMFGSDQGCGGNCNCTCAKSN